MRLPIQCGWRAVLMAGVLGLAALGTAPAAAEKVLRYSFPVAETGFDPAQLSDLYSRTLTAGIFEAPYAYDYLARPFRLVTNTAAALPEVKDEHRVFTVRLKPGTYFADDPAFRGKRRELTAADYVYSLKRHYDPRWKSPNLYLLENAKILGLSELRREVIERKLAFPYDRPVEGLRVLDRYTFQVRLAEPSPRFAQTVLADASAFGAVAREVVEVYGDKIMEHPVGTGPFRLGEWRRSSRIVLERNPGYREVAYDAAAPEDDERSRAIADELRGRRLPLIDKLEVTVVEESQPRWLAFLNGQTDLLDRIPSEYAPVAIPNDTLAPNLARRGVQMDQAPLVDVTIAAFFNMDNPVVGGYDPAQVALRRAIGLAYDSQAEVRLIRQSQAVVAQGPIPPLAYGYDPALKSELGDHDPARAKALLDLYGYVDRNGDGWRERPDGSPLILEMASQSDQVSRQLTELMQKSLREVGLRIVFRIAQWPENLRASRAGSLMMWHVGWLAGTPDGETFLGLAYGPNKGGANHARFALPAFDKLYEQQMRLPDGPERERAMHEAARLMVAYMPYKISAHRIATDLTHPWVIGYRRHPFMRDFYKYVDIDPQRRAGAAP